ncbi:MAG: DUF6147 family protein [Blautia sp.]
MTKHRSLKKRWIPLVVTALVVGMAQQVPVMASNIWDDVIWEDLESQNIDGDYAEDIQYSKTRGNHLNFGRTTITKKSSTNVALSGSTIAHHTCDTLYLYLYLEQEVNGSYGTYKYWRYTGNNLYDLTRSVSVIVPSGYNYRVRGYHAAEDDGNKESRTSLTNGIYVG